jgi:hypothetical protein
LPYKMTSLIVTLSFALYACSDKPPKPEPNYTAIPRATERQNVEVTPYNYNGEKLYIMHVGESLAEIEAREGADYGKGSGPMDMQARLQGRLAIKDGCLVFLTSGGTVIESIVMRLNEFSWDNTTATLTYRGKPYKIGDELISGGGSISADYFPLGSKFVPYNCDINGSFLFLN